MGNDHSQLRAEIRANRQRINILLIGDQGVGKSSFVNTVHSGLTEKRDVMLATPGNTGATRTTTYYRRHDLKFGKIRLFDVPGFDFGSENQLAFLRTMLAGIPSPTKIPLGDENALARLQVNNEPDNKIDFVIFLVDPTDLEKRRTGWFQSGNRGLDWEGREYYKTIFEEVQEACEGHLPYMVYTKKDETYLSTKELVAAFPWFPNNNKWTVANYTERDQRNNETDQTILRIMHNIVVLFQCA